MESWVDLIGAIVNNETLAGLNPGHSGPVAPPSILCIGVFVKKNTTEETPWPPMPVAASFTTPTAM